MKSRNALKLLAAVMLGLLLVGLTGCGDAGGRAKYRSPVMLLITSINGGAPYQSDVYSHAFGGAYNDIVSVAVTVEDMDPDPPEEYPDGTVYTDVIVEEARIEWVRTDSGEAVPASFDQKLNAYVSGTGVMSLVLVRSDQKMMIPLSYLDSVNSYGYEPSTGLHEIHTTAIITIKGRTVSGNPVSAKGYCTVDFADWGDEGE